MISIADIGKVEAARLGIIRAAYELFSTIGYNNATVGMIAENQGFAKEVFYYYFKSKEDVLHAVADYIVGEEGKIFAEITGSEGDPVEKLAAMLRELSDFCRSKSVVGGLAEKRHVDISHRIRGLVMECAVPNIAKILRQGAESGSMRVVEPEQTAKLILNGFFFVFEQCADAHEKQSLLLACCHMSETSLGLEEGVLLGRLSNWAAW